MSDPYAPPQPRSPATVEAPARCPNCGSASFTSPSFTWWGGAVGHKIINHVICNQCRSGFNSKTGKLSTTNIILYQVILAIILIPMALLFIWFVWRI